jgi:hypothetical protein
MQPAAMGIDMIVDATITVGNIIEIITIAVGGIVAIVQLKNSVSTLKKEIALELDFMKTDFTDMKTEIKKVGDVLIKMAVTDQRLLGVEQDVRELKHGRGFIRGPQGIDTEYP